MIRVLSSDTRILFLKVSTSSMTVIFSSLKDADGQNVEGLKKLQHFKPLKTVIFPRWRDADGQNVVFVQNL